MKHGALKKSLHYALVILAFAVVNIVHASEASIPAWVLRESKDMMLQQQKAIRDDIQRQRVADAKVRRARAQVAIEQAQKQNRRALEALEQAQKQRQAQMKREIASRIQGAIGYSGTGVTEQPLPTVLSRAGAAARSSSQVQQESQTQLPALVGAVRGWEAPGIQPEVVPTVFAAGGASRSRSVPTPLEQQRELRLLFDEESGLQGMINFLEGNELRQVQNRLREIQRERAQLLAQIPDVPETSLQAMQRRIRDALAMRSRRAQQPLDWDPRERIAVSYRVPFSQEGAQCGPNTLGLCLLRAQGETEEQQALINIIKQFNPERGEWLEKEQMIDAFKAAARKAGVSDREAQEALNKILFVGTAEGGFTIRSGVGASIDNPIEDILLETNELHQRALQKQLMDVTESAQQFDDELKRFFPVQAGTEQVRRTTGELVSIRYPDINLRRRKSVLNALIEEGPEGAVNKFFEVLIESGQSPDLNNPGQYQRILQDAFNRMNREVDTDLAQRKNRMHAFFDAFVAGQQADIPVAFKYGNHWISIVLKNRNGKPEIEVLNTLGTPGRKNEHNMPTAAEQFVEFLKEQLRDAVARRGRV